MEDIKVVLDSTVIIRPASGIVMDKYRMILETEQHLNNLPPIILPGGDRVHLRFHFREKSDDAPRETRRVSRLRGR